MTKRLSVALSITFAVGALVLAVYTYAASTTHRTCPASDASTQCTSFGDNACGQKSAPCQHGQGNAQHRALTCAKFVDGNGDKVCDLQGDCHPQCQKQCHGAGACKKL